MKRKILKIFALIFCMALFLTGCATVSNVKINGKEANFKEVQYNQGQVVKVGNYIYYGNGYTSSDSDGFSYKKATKSGYLARLNISKDLSFSSKVEDANKKNSTPKGAQQVNDEKLIGFQYQDLYALGEYIYFTSANTHKTSDMENNYSHVSIFRVKYNGDDLKELAKDTAFNIGEGGQITLQKGSDGKYYFVIAETTDEGTFTIKSMKVGEKIGKLKTIVKNAKTYVMADDTSAIKNVVFTVDAEKSQTTTAIKQVDFATGEITTIDEGQAGSETKLLDRVGDEIFYSYTMNSVTEVYHINADTNNSFAPNTTKYFYAASSISDVYQAGNGYVFKTSGGALMYQELNSTADPVLLAESSEYSDILFVEEDMIYLSNTTSIKRISTIDQEVETIVEVKSMISGQSGYVDGYIYFYAQRGELELEEGEEQKADDKYYMYRTDLAGNYQLIGKIV